MGGSAQSAIVQVLRALKDEILSDHVLMIAAGLAFYGLFGMLPALAGAAALWDMVADPAALRQALSAQQLAPADATRLLMQFVTSVPSGFGRGIALALNLGIVVVTAYQAASGLMTALNIVYDETEKRGRVRRALIALAIGTGGLLLLLVALALAAGPPLLAGRGDRAVASAAWLRWPALALMLILALAVLFRFAPSPARRRWSSIACGAAVATALWIAASFGVAVYTSYFGDFGKLYGSLGAVAVVLTWFWVGAVAILTGAEIDAVLMSRRDGRKPSRLKSDLRQRERAR